MHVGNKKTNRLVPSTSERFYMETRYETEMDLARAKDWLASKVETYIRMRRIYEARTEVWDVGPLLTPDVIHEMALGTDHELYWHNYGSGDKEADTYGLEVGMLNLGRNIYLLKLLISQRTDDLRHWDRIHRK